MNTRYLKLIGLMLAGVVLFNFPIVGIFNKNAWVGGLPAAVVYLFSAWLIFIFIIRQIVEPPNFPK